MIPYFPLFGEIDRIASQWFFLSLFNTLSMVYIFYKKDKKEVFDTVFIRRANIIYLIFLSIAFLSSFVAINVAESFVELFRYISFFMSLLIVQTLIRDIRINYLYIFIVLFTTVEASGLMAQHLQGLPMIGFTGNKNIATVSLVLKLNFIYLIIYQSKRQISKMLLAIIPLVSIYLIFTIGSKLGILLLLLSTIAYVTFGVILLVKNNNSSVFYIGLLSSVLLIGNVLYDSNNSVYEAVNNTININNDQGNVDRLRYYSQTFESFKAHPLTGIGFGNWKISSIKYDAATMRNYIVQYHAHNDFLQVLAETGIFGFLALVLFFISSASVLLMKVFKQPIVFFLLIAMMCYLADMNLNFPSARVIAQLNFILIMGLFYTLSNNQKNG